jgi:hypothetical protein
MRKQDDFSKARRAQQVPHRAMLQARPKGKTRIMIMLDDDVLAAFSARAAFLRVISLEMPSGPGVDVWRNLHHR